MKAYLRALALGCQLLLLPGCFSLGSNVKLAPAQRETGREFLIGAETERPGYGLYSYLLFGAPPTPASRERYARAIGAFMSTMLPITSHEEYTPREQLNITYLPLTDPLPAAIASVRPGSQAELSPDAVEWILTHYNYARAAALLRAVPGIHKDGPYIVSYQQPLSGVDRLSGQYLYQDLSTAHPDLVLSWFKAFVVQAAQPDYWNASAIQQWPLALRNAVAIAAVSWPQVQGSLDHLITWKR
jgi:hypothetical protein